MQPETKEIDILPRTPCYSNEAMWKQCEILKSIVTDTKDVKVGRGRAVQTLKVPKHNTPKDVVQRIINSCEHYKNLHEKDMEKREIGSLEVIKYRFEKINGEPKIVIEMVKVLDTNGLYIKFAKLEGVVKYLSKYPIKFKDL
jgi:hypothetical protein